jgi:hypothetical protein
VGGTVDYVDEARRLGSQQFCAGYPCFFLVSTAQLVKPTRAGTAIVSERMAAKDPTGALPVITAADNPALRPLVLAVKKHIELFPSMITVGRTHNNDLVIEDVQISKLHAFFQVAGPRITLHDAGSRNGTFVGATQLKPKGPGAAVESGQSIRFGKMQLHLLSNRACWEWVADRFSQWD